MTQATCVDTQRVFLRCVVCGRCNAGVSGNLAEVRLFVHCKKCGEVTEARKK